MSKEFYALIRKVRDKIERGKMHFSLMTDKIKWNRFCASIYAIEDSQCAIDAYCDLPFPDDINGKYLYTYGLLQAFFLQQDSANGLSFSLRDKKIKWETDYPLLYKIREIRNNTIGHPTIRTHGKGDSATFSFIQIRQTSLNKRGFDYHLYDQENDFQFKIENVDLASAIIEQQRSITEILEAVCTYLDQEYYDYLKKFEEDKMAEIFELLDYSAEKAFEDKPMEAWGIDSAKGMVAKCKEALVARYGAWDNLDCFHYLIEDIEKIFFLIERPTEYRNHLQIKHYMTELAFIKLRELRDLCQEIDNEFETDLKETLT
ncbi:MAG: hypothetical protein RR231_15710 [Acinetobacter sp.]